MKTENISSVEPYKMKAGFVLPSVGKANYGHSLASHPCVEIGRRLLGAPNVTLNMLIGLEGVLYANTQELQSEISFVKKIMFTSSRM